MTSAANEQSAATEVFMLINERLGHMEGVANHKMHAQSPIEDRAREKVVIDKAVLSAKELGFDTQSIAQFFKIQIQVAKAIQHRVSADLLIQPNAKTFPDLHNDIRPELIRLSGAINLALANYLDQHAFKEEQRPLFVGSLDNPYLSMQDKHALFNALLKIKLSQ